MSTPFKQAFGFIVLVSVGVYAAAAPASAEFISFEPTIEVSSLSGGFHDIATDGAGVWVAVWTDRTYPNTVMFSRSSDNARTWSPAALLSGGAWQYDAVRVATDRQGTWIAVWGYGEFNPSRVRYALSHDNGVTWDAPQDLAEDAGRPDVAIGANGTWVVAWGLGGTVIETHSTNGGVNWSPEQMIISSSASGLVDIATDDQGHWVVAVSGDRIHETHSLDDGVTWSSQATYGDVFSYSPVVATDKQGRWLIAFVGPTNPPVEHPNSAAYDLFLIESADNGASWSLPRTLDPNAAQTIQPGATVLTPTLAYSDGVWLAAWGATGKPYQRELDSVFSISTDGAQTWRRPAAVNGDAARDGTAEEVISLATDDAGTWAVLMRSGYDTVRVAVSKRDCPVLPLPDCKGTLTAGGSKLQILNRPGVKDSLRWTLKHGAATDALEFGDPVNADHFVMCLYQTDQLVTELVFEKDVPLGVECGTESCWSATSTGFAFEDRQQTRSSTREIELVAGDDERAKIALTSSGPALNPPDMPFATGASLTAQLLNTTNQNCWEATFSSPRRNLADVYKAQSD